MVKKTAFSKCEQTSRIIRFVIFVGFPLALRAGTEGTSESVDRRSLAGKYGRVMASGSPPIILKALLDQEFRQNPPSHGCTDRF